MKCPKCGSRHIVDGMCVMCGTLVIHDVEASVRTCLACGRQKRFVGSVCRDCGDAISRGAKALQKAAQRNINSDKAPVFAECPVLPFLDGMWEKFHAARMRRKETSQAAARRYYETHREEIRARAKERAQQINESGRRYRQTEKGKATRKQYRLTSKYRAKHAAYMREYRLQHLEQFREKDRLYRERKKAEFLALPLAEQKAIKESEKHLQRAARDAAKKRELRKDPEWAERERERKKRWRQSEKGKAYAEKFNAKRRFLRWLARLDKEKAQQEAA